MPVIINVLNDKTNVYKDGDFIHLIKLGAEDIAKFGFEVVDHMVEDIIKCIEKDDNVTVNGASIESKMIARKIEDKIKREVEYYSREVI